MTALPYLHMLCAAWCELPTDSSSSSGSSSADCRCSRAAGDHLSVPLLQQTMLVLTPPVQDHHQVCFKPSAWTALSNLVQTRQHLSYSPLHQQSLLQDVFGRVLTAEDIHELNQTTVASDCCSWKDVGSSPLRLTTARKLCGNSLKQ